jgi:hypothetical protein
MYHSEMVSLRLSTTLLKRVDEQRGGTPRSAYLRKIIEKGVGAVDPEPPEVEPPHETVRTNAPPPLLASPGAVEQIRPDGKPEVPHMPMQMRHLHRYERKETVRFHRGTPIRRWVCVCGAEKES